MKHIDLLSAIYFIVIVLLIVPITVKTLMDVGAESRQSQVDYVQHVCERSRLSPTITEEQCGQAQDDTNLVYMCAEANNRPDNYCWVQEQ